jgi:hypothetical protein
VVLRILNRFIDRTDSSSVWAVNAYVEGSASDDEVKLVEEMMRRDPALGKDLSTQRALRDVLSRIENVEAPRSFAVTPEMVAAAERSESGLSRLAELFAPQRKLAMAPAVIAVIAAVGVALLTIGDITGTVDQTGGGRDDSSSSASFAESAATSGGGAAAESAPSMEMAVVTEKASAGATAAPAATAMTAVAPLAPDDSAITLESATGGGIDEPASLAAPEPEMALMEEEPEIVGDGDSEDDSARSKSGEQLEVDGPESDDADTTLEFGTGGAIDEDPITSAGAGTGDGSFAGAADGAASSAAAGAGEGALAGAAGGAGEGAGKGISLPLWQLQIALAALAVAAIGAWAGLRRVRGE